MPLAEFLAAKGFRVKGSTKSPEKLKLLALKNIQPFHIELNPLLQGDNVNDFFKSDLIVINIPPGGGDDKVNFHTKQLESILAEVKNSPIRKIIFIGSTSVYRNENRMVTENDELHPEKESGKALKIVEGLLLAEQSFEKCIIRFAGLVDTDRNPVKFFAGRKNIPGGNIPVNLIHREDCINIIHQVIIRNVWNQIFNACSDLHPPKKEFYTAAAQKLNLPLPEFIDTDDSYKIVNSDKLKKMLGYNFIYPDPLTML